MQLVKREAVGGVLEIFDRSRHGQPIVARIYDAMMMEYLESAKQVIEAARAVECDLWGNADSRVRGGFTMIESVRIRNLESALRSMRDAEIAE